MQFIPQDIIISPVITERSTDNLTQGKYTFKVDKRANKIEIKKAIEALFAGVKVKKVNTMNVRGQLRRQRMKQGYTASWKKAIVTLAEGSKTIEFFDGMV
ncbi:MAG: 50S ribosomal protein L23 [Oscillospiraceae bacterium]|nr:50S ribosomal protein L23 [Oscillospiraceae bacterium]